jgi:hypothetical protein
LVARSEPLNSTASNNMIDVMDIKLKVIEAACGITALGEVELLQRLEKLYIDGMKAGVDALRDATMAKANTSRNLPADPLEAWCDPDLLVKHCSCPGGLAEHRKDCFYVR